MVKLYKLFILANIIHSSSAFCPDQCICNNDSLETSCIETNLEVNKLHVYVLYSFNIVPGDANDFEPKHENIDTKIQQLSLSRCKF